MITTGYDCYTPPPTTLGHSVPAGDCTPTTPQTVSPAQPTATVGVPPVSGGGLAFTGADVAGTIVLGVALIVAGFGVVRASLFRCRS
jgi:hypothetical protein